MTTRSLRTRLNETSNIWPGFVDVLATLLIVIIFRLNAPTPTPASVWSGPVDCSGGPLDSNGIAMTSNGNARA